MECGRGAAMFCAASRLCPVSEVPTLRLATLRARACGRRQRSSALNGAPGRPLPSGRASRGNVVVLGRALWRCVVLPSAKQDDHGTHGGGGGGGAVTRPSAKRLEAFLEQCRRDVQVGARGAAGGAGWLLLRPHVRACMGLQ